MKCLKDYEQIWEEFWKPICTNEDGSINLDQIKRELADFKDVIGNVSKVYDSITGGRFSKPLTRPEYVISAAEDYYGTIYMCTDH